MSISLPALGSARSAGSAGSSGRRGSPNADFMSKQVSTISRSDLQRIRNTVSKGGAEPDAVVISTRELERMKATAHQKTSDDHLRAQREQEAKAAAIRERKERMMRIDEEKRRNGATKDEFEQEDETKKRGLLERAFRQMDEELDEVKNMNQMVLYSKCVTIRDAQLQEKARLAKEREEEERRLDLIMEMERVKALQMYEEREQRRVEDRRKGATVIRAQMDQREKERLRQLELREQEQEAMLRHIERMREEDARETEVKKESGKRMMEEVVVANAEQIRMKQRQKEAEAEEEIRISEYLREKEKREAEYQEEQAKIRAEKEKEVARLRAMQEKAQDKQAELDALRAKRAQEQLERDWRRKEKETAERQTRVNQELLEARERQRLEKERLLAQQIRTERDAFNRVISVKKHEEESEKMKEIEEAEHRKQHATFLKAQIDAQSETRRKERQEFIQEGERLRRERELERAKVQRIQQSKLEGLVESGVPSKYTVELQNRKIGVEALRPAVGKVV